VIKRLGLADQRVGARHSSATLGSSLWQVNEQDLVGRRDRFLGVTQRVRDEFHAARYTQLVKNANEIVSNRMFAQAGLNCPTDAELIEDARSEPFWGIGPDGLGQNHAGRLLVEIRALLRRPPETQG
jgi:predicted NAD-dependent protein-ADP-ribosyltransferase YbiA (DUF1768 family)